MTKEFKSQDFSATAPILRRLFSDPILNMIPKSVSPNALTLFGGCAAGGTAMILWLADWLPQAQTFNGRIILTMGAFLLVVYAICDQLDGLQARRIARGGPSGDFLDHWIDALLANLIPIGLMNFMVYDFYFTLCMTIVVALAFWANNWETKTHNARKLPFLGGLEFIWVGVFCLLATAMWGKTIWDMELFTVELRHWAYLVVISTLGLSILKNAYNGKERIAEILTPLASFSGIALFLISQHEMGDSNWYTHYFGLMIIGLMGVKHTGDQMRQLWLNEDPVKLELYFIIPAIVLAAMYIFKDQNPLLAKAIAPVLFTLVLFCIWCLCFQSVRIFTLLAERYKSLPHQQTAVRTTRIMVDMSATLLHHGHIRLLKQAKALGHVVVGLTSDADLKSVKNLHSELSFVERKEILLELTTVDEVVETPWLLTNAVLAKHNIDYLVHGDDNQNQIAPEKLVIFPRTEGISSAQLRKRAAKNIQA